MGAAIGAFIGGLFSRSSASTGGATGALVGALIAEKSHSAGGVIEKVTDRSDGESEDESSSSGLKEQLSGLKDTQTAESE